MYLKPRLNRIGFRLWYYLIFFSKLARISLSNFLLSMLILASLLLKIVVQTHSSCLHPLTASILICICPFKILIPDFFPQESLTSLTMHSIFEWGWTVGQFSSEHLDFKIKNCYQFIAFKCFEDIYIQRRKFITSFCKKILALEKYIAAT